MAKIKIIELQKPWISLERYRKFLEKSRKHNRESILFCEHPPTITAGVQSRPENLLVSIRSLLDSRIEFHKTARGGDHTAHEPGQLLCYVHLALGRRERKLGHLFAALLSAAQDSIRDVWGLATRTRREAPGLYTDDGKKLLSIGLDFRKQLTGYGIALNVNNSLEIFGLIHPCGERGLQPTSIQKELFRQGARSSLAEDTLRFKRSLCTHLFDWLEEKPEGAVTQ